MVDSPTEPEQDPRGSHLSAKRDDAALQADRGGWHWPGGAADQRLTQSIGQLAAVLRASEPEAEPDRLAKRNALISLRNARRELDRHWAHNEEAWAWFHAARREEFRLWTPVNQELLEIDLKFSERFIPSLVARQEPGSASAQTGG